VEFELRKRLSIKALKDEISRFAKTQNIGVDFVRKNIADSEK
jgi:hypothetical protein